MSRRNQFLDAQNQIRRAARKYLIVAGKLTPIVYTSVKDSGVMLTIRYMVNPRMRRHRTEDLGRDIDRVSVGITDRFSLSVSAFYARKRSLPA